MSDSNSQDSSRRRRRRGPRSRTSSGSQGGRDSFRHTSTPRSGLQQPTGIAKLLNILSFGILCKPKPVSRPPRPGSSSSQVKSAAPRSSDSPRPPREPREPREPKPRREPTQVNPADITTERLYVGNLSYDATESDLFELFNGVGAVRNAEVVVNNRTQRSKGFAFVTMGSVEEARRAVQELNGKDFMNRPLQLSGAKPLGENDRRRDEDSSESETEAAA